MKTIIRIGTEKIKRLKLGTTPIASINFLIKEDVEPTTYDIYYPENTSVGYLVNSWTYQPTSTAEAIANGGGYICCVGTNVGNQYITPLVYVWDDDIAAKTVLFEGDGNSGNTSVWYDSLPVWRFEYTENRNYAICWKYPWGIDILKPDILNG